MIIHPFEAKDWTSDLTHYINMLIVVELSNKFNFNESTEILRNRSDVGMTNRLPLTTRSLPIALMRARESVMTPIREMLAETGLSEQQWRVLRVLAEQGEMDSHSLAKQACLLFPSLTRMAATMNAKGLITQTRDPKDRRRQLIAITPAGTTIIESRVEAASAIARDFRRKIGDDDYETLLDLLGRLSAETQGQDAH